MSVDLIRRALAFASAPPDAISDDALAEVYRGCDGLREYREDLYETSSRQGSGYRPRVRRPGWGRDEALAELHASR